MELQGTIERMDLKKILAVTCALSAVVISINVFLVAQQAGTPPQEQKEPITVTVPAAIETTKNEVFSASTTLDILRKNLSQKEFVELKSRMDNNQLTEQDNITIADILVRLMEIPHK